MFESLLILLERRRLWFQGVAVVLLITGAVFAWRLRILDSPERWMPASSMQAWDVFASHFDVGDMIALGVHFQRAVTDEDSQSLARLRDRLTAIQGMKRVYDPSLVADQIEHVPLTQLLDPANAQRYSLYAGALWDQPTPGKPGRTLMCVCEIELLPFSADADATEPLNKLRRHVVGEVYRILEEERAGGALGEQVEFHLASSIVMMSELERRARQVAWTFLPASIGVGLLSLLWGFRSWRALLMATLGGMFAMLLVLGWAGASQGTVGVLTTAAPSLMSIIAIATTVHFASYAAERHAAGRDTAPRVEGGVSPERRQLIREVAVPCMGAAATTGFGFLMLCFNELGPVRDLGIQLFLGALLSFFGVFLVSQWLPIRRAIPAGFLTHGRFAALCAWVTQRPRTVVAVTAVSSVLFVFLAWPRPANQPIGLYVDADAFSFFADDQPISRAMRHFADRDFGIYQLDVVLVPRRATAAAGVTVDPAAGGATVDLAAGGEIVDQAVGVAAANSEDEDQAVSAFSDQMAELRELGVVRVVSTQAFRRRQAEFQVELNRIRQEEGLAAYLDKLRGVVASAAIFSDTFQNWNRDKLNQGAARVTLLASSQGPTGFRPLVEAVKSALPTDRFDCYLSGSIADSQNLAEGLTGGIIWGLGSSLALMLLLCVGLFRSWRLAAIAMVPNVVPNLAVFGLMGLFKLPISSGSAMVSTVALGIAMNDTIHFMLHYRHLTRGMHLSTQAAVARTVEDLGRPIVLTSVVHIVGFAIFLLTDFQPLFHFGVLASASMLAALGGDLIVLPSLLLVFDRRPGGLPAAPVAKLLPEVATADVALSH